MMNELVDEGTGWIDVGPLEEIPRLGARVLRSAQGDIAVFRSADDQVFAVDDRCPHRGGPLSQGIVFGNRVACPLHDWVVDLALGCAVGPDEGCVRRHGARVQGGRVLVSLAPAEPSPRADAAADTPC